MKAMPLSWRIGFRHITARKKQSVVAALSVTFGISMFIVMISFMTGINDLLEDTLLDASPHIHLYHEISAQKPILAAKQYPESGVVLHHPRPEKATVNLRNISQIREFLNSDTKILGYSEQLSTQLFFLHGSVQLGGIVMGINPESEDRIFSVEPRMVQGRFSSLNTENNGIIIGAGLAKKLGVEMGDEIRVVSVTGDVFRMKICGIFEFGIAQLDQGRAYSNIGSVQRMLHKPRNYVTDIQIKLKDIHIAKEVSRSYAKLFSCNAQDWETANASILVSFTIRNTMTIIVSITLLLVAGFGIYNIMNMNIQNKMKDIAILNALGLNAQDIRAIFLTQAVVIGFLGGLGGMIVGGILSKLLSYVPFNVGEYMKIRTMPVAFELSFYIWGLAFGILTTLLAGWVPSVKASKVDPVEIIRGK